MLKTFLLSVLFFFTISGHSLYGASVNFARIVNTIDTRGLSLQHEHLISNQKYTVATGKKIVEADLLRDINALFLSGYFESVQAKTVEDKLLMTLVYELTPYPNIEGLTILGSEVILESEIQSVILNKVGQPLNALYLREDSQLITDYLALKGYDLTLVKAVDFNSKTGHVEIHLEEKKVGQIHFHGLNQIHSFVLIRQMQLKPSQTFNSITLRQDRQRFLQLGYFSSFSPPRLIPDDDKPHIVHVHFDIKEKKNNLLNLGLEQEDDKVVSFLQGSVHHTLMHSDRFTAKVQMEPENSNYSVRSYRLKYTQPWLLNRYPTSFSVGFWTEFQREFLTRDLLRSALFQTQRQGFDVTLGVPLIHDKLTYFLKYKDEFISHRENTTAFSPYYVNSINNKLEYFTLKDRHNPKEGMYGIVNFEQGGDIGFAQLRGLKFTRVSLNTARFFSFTERSTIGLRSFAGYFEPKDNNISTFDAEGFVMGGANSLRGYKTADHTFIGNREILFNAEFRYNFSESIQGVAFYDIGKTFNDEWILDLSRYETGKGIGLRFFTPVGPVRIDFALQDDFMIHFGLGQLF